MPPPAPPGLFESTEAAPDPSTPGETAATDLSAPPEMELLAPSSDPEEASRTPEISDGNLYVLQQAVESFQSHYRRDPTNLEQLLAARLLPNIPRAPEGKKYVFNPKTGQVESVNK